VLQDLLEWMPVPLLPKAAPMLSGGPRPGNAQWQPGNARHGPLTYTIDPHAWLTARRPAAAGGDGVGAALAAWADLACQRRAVPRADRSGLDFCSLLTLLHLVAGLAGRVRGLLPPGQLLSCGRQYFGYGGGGGERLMRILWSCLRASPSLRLPTTCPMCGSCAGTSGWRGLADGLAAACSVPQSYRLQLRALCCWALQGGGRAEAG
jgi:hypothetical protein